MKILRKIFVYVFVVVLVAGGFTNAGAAALEPKIASIANQSIEVEQGKSYVLPKTVKAAMSDQTSKDYPVKWSKTRIDTSKLGIQTVSGTVAGYANKVVLTISVVPKIESIADLYIDVRYGESYKLPAKVTGKLKDQSIREVNVKWNTAEVNTASINSYVHEGTVVGYAKPVKLIVRVLGIASIRNESFIIEKEDQFNLPSTVTAVLTDGSAKDVAVAWNKKSIDTNIAGAHLIEGTVMGYKDKVTYTVTVKDVVYPTNAASIGTFTKVDNSAVMAKYGSKLNAAGKLEYEKRSSYKDTEANESSKPTETELITSLTRGLDLYPNLHGYMLSFLMDPLCQSIAAEMRAGTSSPDEIARNIIKWAPQNLLHAQTLAVFRDQPGKDPWGQVGNWPLYKHVIPAEMLAKSMFTGKLTGKCDSIAVIGVSLFVLNGAELDDAVVLRLSGHDVGLVNFGGKMYLVNNQKISEVGPTEKNWLKSQNFIGFFNYSGSFLRNFGAGRTSYSINDTFFNSGDHLLDRLLVLTDTKSMLEADKRISFSRVEDPALLVDAIMGKASNDEAAKTYTLARYAYQSIYVKHPEIYLKASMKAPKTIELAGALKSKAAVFRWIKENVEEGSIFEDSSQRFMTADEVILFRKGNLKDQAILAFSLLKLNGYKPVILITREHAYIQVDGKTYDASNWSVVEKVTGEVALRMSLD